jgi:hypothetical protein
LGGSKGFPFIVILLHFRKDAVCQGFTSEEQTIKTNPFGTSKGRSLHVVGTLDDRDF